MNEVSLMSDKCYQNSKQNATNRIPRTIIINLLLMVVLKPIPYHSIEYDLSINMGDTKIRQIVTITSSEGKGE